MYTHDPPSTSMPYDLLNRTRFPLPSSSLFRSMEPSDFPSSLFSPFDLYDDLGENTAFVQSVTVAILSPFPSILTPTSYAAVQMVREVFTAVLLHGFKTILLQILSILHSVSGRSFESQFPSIAYFIMSFWRKSPHWNRGPMHGGISVIRLIKRFSWRCEDRLRDYRIYRWMTWRECQSKRRVRLFSSL